MVTSSNGNIIRVTGPLWGIYRSRVNSPHKDQWRGALMVSVICTWTNGWVNNLYAGDFRCHCTHYDVTVMEWSPGVIQLASHGGVDGVCWPLWLGIQWPWRTTWSPVQCTNCDKVRTWRKDISLCSVVRFNLCNIIYLTLKAYRNIHLRYPLMQYQSLLTHWGRNKMAAISQTTI